LIEAFLNEIKNSPVEKLGIIMHNTTGAFAAKIVGVGTEKRCTVKFSVIAEAIAENRASMITLVHNHPAGEVRPSREDLELTYSLQDKLKAAGVKINDHVILGRNGGVYSFADNGAL
jgi:DNA repair protein RadC